jgi:hypothetical protein
LIICAQKDLFLFGSDKNLKYETYLGYNWANYYFQAPLIFFQLLNKLGKELIQLTEIADIKRGITTNCNDFFILTQIKPNIYQNGYGEQFELEGNELFPIIISPRQVEKPHFNPKTLQSYIFYTNKSLNELKTEKDLRLREYVKYGMTKTISIKKGTKKGFQIQGIHNLASFKEKYNKNPSNWYCLKPKKISKISPSTPIKIQKIYDTSIKLVFCPDPIFVNNTFYEIYLKHPYDSNQEVIFALLMGSLTYLSLELHGRINFGGGALDTATFDIGKIIIPNPDIILNDSECKLKILRIIKPILNREIFPVNIELKREDRRHLDELLFQIMKVPINIDTFYEAILKIQDFRIKKSNS